MDVGALWDSVGDCAPAFPQIRRLKNIRLEIIQPVTVNCDVGPGRVVRRRIDNRDRAPLRHLWRNVRPALAVISCDMHQSVIRPGPERSLFFWRFRQRENGIVIFDARDVIGERTATWLLFRFIVFR